MPPNPPLRIAILVDTSSVDEWQFQMLERVQNNGTGSVVLAVVRGETKTATGESEKRSLALSLLNRYLRWDLRKFAELPDPYRKRSSIELTESIAIETMTPEVTTGCDRLAQKDVDTLREHNIDVIIQLGWQVLQGELLSVPRYGVWSYHHGDNQLNRGGPPGVWEHYYAKTCTGITLQILSENSDNPLVIDRSNIATDKTSVSKTRFKLYWRSLDMLPRKLAELHQLGYEEFEQQARHLSPAFDFYSQPLLSEASVDLKTALTYIWRSYSAYVKRALFQRRFDEKWMLYYKLGDELSTSLGQFSKLESPNDRYWADPHTIERDGTFYVFVEEFIYATGRGRIAVIPIEKDGSIGKAQTALETDYHLSYPFVFEHDGHTYMIPESSNNRSLDIFQCTSFPNKWEYVKTLMNDVRAKDATLFQHDGLWWLFTNMCELKGNNNDELDELHLFFATHFLTDEWTPHTKDVIASDVCYARPAGSLFKNDGKIYRPAQDSSEDYGYAMQLQEITQLTKDDYQETLVSRMTPDWNEQVIGVHTLSYVPGITVVDAKTRIKKSDVEKN